MLSRRAFLASSALAALLPAGAAALPIPKDNALQALVGLPGIDGPALSADEIEGKAVLITFWASWCPPCSDEFQHFNQVQRVYGDRDLTVLGINVYEEWRGLSNPAKRARFIKRMQPRFRLVEGDPSLLQTFGGVNRIPTVFLFDAKGDIAYLFVHEKDATKMHVTFGELKPILDNLLG